MEAVIEEIEIKKYPAYKDSGYQWLESIPRHWMLKRIKFELNYQKGKNPKEIVLDETGHVYLSMEYLRSNHQKIQYIKSTKDLVNVTDNDILLLWDGSNAGEFIIGKKGVLSSTMALISINGANKKFAWYYLKIIETQLRESTIGMGIPHVSSEELDNLPFLLPPKDEQTAIAQFLDHKTALINQAISIKEKQIELLKERRQILIHKAVTRGLNPNVKMKDSGVEWIGEIPEHWEVKKIKHFANVVLGKMLCSENKGSYQLKPYLKSKNIQWLNVDVSSIDEMWFSENEMLKYRLNKGDLVLSEGGEVGKTCIWDNELEECYIQNSAHKVTFYENNIQKYYLNLFFAAGKVGLFESIVNKVSIGHLTKDKLINVEVLHPPKLEQLSISEYIENASRKIAAVISLKEKEIEKLKEYKATLINSAVTGKIKVC